MRELRQSTAARPGETVTTVHCGPMPVTRRELSLFGALTGDTKPSDDQETHDQQPPALVRAV
jgi:hypothetical protein